MIKNAITILVLIGVAVLIKRTYNESKVTQVKLKANGT
jgi:hypothetical protein